MPNTTAPTTLDPLAEIRILLDGLKQKQRDALAHGAVLVLHGASFIDALGALLDGQSRAGINPAHHNQVVTSIMGRQHAAPLCFATTSHGWPAADAEGWWRDEEHPQLRMKSDGAAQLLRCDGCGKSEQKLYPIEMAEFSAWLASFTGAHAGCNGKAVETLPAPSPYAG